jgi:DNA-binding IclR family transcriptional regulator
MKDENRGNPLIQSVERALDALEAIAVSDRPLKNAEIAEIIKIKPNTANNILRTLFQKGYLAQDDRRGYILGPKCAILAKDEDETESLRRAAIPIMRNLAEQTGDLVFLGILNRFDLICLEQVTGTGAITISDSHAWNEKTHASACGKLLLSFLSQQKKEVYLKRSNREIFTKKTITSETALRKELKSIAANGFATSIDESATGVSAIGVPIYNNDDQVVAALGQSFPTYFLEKGKINLKERIGLLKNTATKIGEATC